VLLPRQGEGFEKTRFGFALGPGSITFDFCILTCLLKRQLSLDPIQLSAVVQLSGLFSEGDRLGHGSERFSKLLVVTIRFGQQAEGVRMVYS
jgi:hypothetical protein